MTSATVIRDKYTPGDMAKEGALSLPIVVFMLGQFRAAVWEDTYETNSEAVGAEKKDLNES